MITRNRMKFLAPEPDGFGGTVAEPAVLEPMTPVGDIYKAALAESQGKEPEPPSAATGPASTGAPDASGPAATGAPAATGPAKPASALDAVLDDAPAASGATGPAAPEENDFLKDLPETLPREGRGAHWEKARGAIKTQGQTISQLHKTVAEITKQLEEAKTAPPQSAAEVAALQKQLDEYKDAVVGINVELDPEHRKKFVDGRAGLVGKAASKLNAFGGKGELITEAMGMPEGRARSLAIKEALTDLDDVDRGRVLQFIGEVEKLDDEKADLMKDPQGAWAKLQESEKSKVQAAAQKAEEYKQTVFETVSKALPAEYFLLRSVDPSLPGATEHNADIEQIKVDALKLLGSDAKPEDLVRAAYAKHLMPKLQAFLVASRKELATAMAALKEYEKADPGFRGGPGPKKTPEEAKLDKTPGQLYHETLAKLSGGQDE